ncbi:hypothetical protein [Vibrio splendidus]|uniref:hypothetical protein n=1 Tax=Vibrio splendidus TaxID=29497 RepID=UPI00352DA130
MTRITAPDNKQALKKRVERFFSPNESKASKSSKAFRGEVYDFVELLTKNNDLGVYAFGGLVRDIGLFSVRNFSSDVDLVVDGSLKELKSVLSRLPSDAVVIENKFGGFRIKQKQWDFDVWCAKDTWAIKNKFVEYEGVESLLDTTFLNWDSALFDVRNRKLICHHDYLKNLQSGAIDVVLVDSPNELGSLVRLGRAIYGKGARKLKRRAIESLQQSFGTYSIDQIIKYEVQSYSSRFLSETNLGKLKERVVYLDDDVKEVDLFSEEQLSFVRCERENGEQHQIDSNNLLISQSKLIQLKEAVVRTECLNQEQIEWPIKQLSFPFV